jgi:hypothetical protein
VKHRPLYLLREKLGFENAQMMETQQSKRGNETVKMNDDEKAGSTAD